MKRFVSLQFLNLRQSIGFLGREISPPQGHYLHRITQKQNKHGQTAMSREREKTFYALDRAVTVIGNYFSTRKIKFKSGSSFDIATRLQSG
jgi:hypothetical protein